MKYPFLASVKKIPLLSDYVIFAFVLLSSIFQFYFIQISGSYFSLALFSVFLLIPLALKNINLLTWKPFLFLILIMIFQVLSFSWSVDLKLGLRSVLGFVLFLIVVMSAYEITKRYPKKVLDLFLLYFVFILSQAFLVIYFYFNPSDELVFIHSDVVKIFINPNTIKAIFHGTEPHAFGVGSPGGFFVNPNVGAAFLGINALISYGFSKAYSIIWLKAITLILIVGVVFSGSKAGLILIVFLMFLALIVPNFINQFMTLKRVMLILFVISVLFFVLLFLGNGDFQNNFIKNTIRTTDIRISIWNYGLNEFFKHPITGLGFGGWQQGFSEYALGSGIRDGHPPHNTFIYLWVQSGISVVVFAILFIISVLKHGVNLVMTHDTELLGIGIAVLGAFLWTFVHGMGTNFGLVGEIHMEVILAALLGYSLARFESYTIMSNCDEK